MCGGFKYTMPSDTYSQFLDYFSYYQFYSWIDLQNTNLQEDSSLLTLLLLWTWFNRSALIAAKDSLIFQDIHSPGANDILTRFSILLVSAINY